MYNHERVTYGSDKSVVSIEDPQERAEVKPERKKPFSNRCICLASLPLVVFLIGLAIYLAIHNSKGDDSSDDSSNSDVSKDNGMVPVYEPKEDGSDTDANCGFELDQYHRVGEMPCEALADFTPGQEALPQCLETLQEELESCQAKCCELEDSCFGVEHHAVSRTCRMFMRSKEETLIRHAYESGVENNADLILSWKIMDAELADTDLHLEDLYREVTELRAALAKEREAAEERNVELRDLKKEFDDLENKMTTVAKERSQVVAELNEYKNEAMKEYSELENKMTICASQLEAREDMLCKSAIERELAKFEERLYKSELVPCKNQLSAFQKQNDELEAQLKKKQLELIKAQIDKAKALEEKEKKLSATRQMYTEYKERLAASEALVAKLTKEKATLEKTLALTMSERAACLDEVVELKHGNQACAKLMKEKDKALMAEQKKFWATLGKLEMCQKDAETLRKQIETNDSSPTSAPTTEYEDSVLSA